MTKAHCQLNIRVPETTARLLDLIKDREGVPIAEQVRRGILLYAESKGVHTINTDEQRPRKVKGISVRYDKTRKLWRIWFEIKKQRWSESRANKALAYAAAEEYGRRLVAGEDIRPKGTADAA